MTRRLQPGLRARLGLVYWLTASDEFTGGFKSLVQDSAD